MPLLVQIIKPVELAALQTMFPSLDLQGMLRSAEGSEPERPRLHFTDAPTNPEAKFRFYDRMMREGPKRHAGREQKKHRQTRRGD